MIWVFEGLNNDRPDITYYLEKYLKITPNVLFWDKTPTWYCSDRWQNDIQQALETYGSPSLLLGASMGGFGALLFQPMIKAKNCIIFGPQSDSRYEILSKLPGDNIFWANRMKHYIGKTIPRYSTGNIDIYFGYNECDKYHRQKCLELNYQIIDIDTPIHCSFTYLFEERKLENIIKDKIC